MEKKVGVGLIGSQFISTIHFESLTTVADAEVLAVMSPTQANASAFTKEHGILYQFTDLDALLAMERIDRVVIGTPISLTA
ncbi:Oxidoreductase family, NAD-binding Rossmann fold [Pricia antarctica]|uniref:Oxidoreductase family, NAD-binding Rossmann fold n=1 Tax=Pricia antarctica TaxID=641691 RepID=A0A1G6XXM7_9FLAO|nr:Gfo/Idh/MocA family oxidoreductase [Pricia antarctica]SDD82155.1 Oxidoreductase family, NAD-binding Rossmann fold [Pricia antarctica]